MTLEMSTATLCEAFQRTAANGAGHRRAQPATRRSAWERVRRAACEAIATGLHALGVRAGDVVAILLRNRPAFNLADTAALHLGATPFSLYATEP